MKIKGDTITLKSIKGEEYKIELPYIRELTNYTDFDGRGVYNIDLIVTNEDTFQESIELITTDKEQYEELRDYLDNQGKLEKSEEETILSTLDEVKTVPLTIYTNKELRKRKIDMKIENEIIAIVDRTGEGHNFPVENIKELTTYFNEENDETAYCICYNDNPIDILIEVNKEHFYKIQNYLSTYESVISTRKKVETETKYFFK